MKVRYSPQALRQIDETFTYIAEENEVAAHAVIARIEAVATLLGIRPYIGRSTGHQDVRAMSVRPYPYVIFYKILGEDDEVRIMRIRHTARR